MEKQKSLCLKLCCLLLSVFLMLPACSAGMVAHESAASPESMKNVLVLPFKDISALYGEENNLRCPVCGKVFLTGNVAEGADVILTKHLISLLKSHTGFKIIYPGEERMLSNGFNTGNENRPSEVKKIAENGQLLGADTVIIGHIYRFRERAGTSYSVESPASVAFDLHFISVPDGRVVWTGHMDETQRPLSENLFEIGSFIKRKGEWVTAGDLAISGLESMLRIFFTK
ncbi:MAG: hypothetical protein Q8N95_12505 [Desulfobacterales bacterium]|nr:hypothetical protein [Desulfobacterales bacterium]